VLLGGLGGDAQDGVADAELRLAEGGGVVGVDEVAGDGQQVLVGGLGDGGGQRLGLGFLLGGEGLLQRGLTDKGGGLFTERRSSSLVYKDSTNCRDAHTPLPARPGIPFASAAPVAYDQGAAPHPDRGVSARFFVVRPTRRIP
jgi:hypothetical protein